MSHAAILEINLAAIAANFRECQILSKNAACGAAVKADAYGLGIKQIAPILYDAGCRHFFVAHFEEGVALRQIMPNTKIFILHGFLAKEADNYLKHDLIPVLNSTEEILTYGKKPQAIMVDTGINRLGVRPEEAVDSDYIFTHFACVDVQNHPLNALQIERFKAVAARFPNAKISMANSEGLHLDVALDLTRPGIALYDGINPVVTLKAPILMTKSVKKGESIGYGATFTANKDMLISIASLGYADGFMRQGQQGRAKIRGKFCPVVGRISMDLIAIDTDVFNENPVKSQEYAIFIDDEIRLGEVAKTAGTISYELLTRLGNRLKRIYI